MKTLRPVGFVGAFLFTKIMRKIFEGCDGNCTIEFSRDKDSDITHIFIECPEDSSRNTELLFNQNSILEIISELSQLLIDK